MSVVTWKPPPSQVGGVAAIRVGEVHYTFSPNVPQDVPKEHLTAVQTKLAALRGTLAHVAAGPGLANQGASGAASVTYEVVATGPAGDATPSPTTTIANANANLGGGNGVVLTWVAPADPFGARTGFKIIRTAGGPSQGLVATVAAGATTYTDTGTAATTYTPAGADPGVDLVTAGPNEI